MCLDTPTSSHLHAERHKFTHTLTKAQGEGTKAHMCLGRHASTGALTNAHIHDTRAGLYVETQADTYRHIYICVHTHSSYTQTYTYGG